MPPEPQNPAPLAIDLAEQFENLPRAPIVEAVIQISGRVQAVWEENTIGRTFVDALPNYTSVQGLNTMRMKIEQQDAAAAAAAGQAIQGLPEGVQPSSGVLVASNMHTGFEGLRMATADGKWVAQFMRDTFALSRLAPYESWAELCDEAMRLWEVHCRIGNIQDVARVGCRFINRMEVPVEGLHIAAYFKDFGAIPFGFQLSGFVQQNALYLPGYPYQINVTKTHQPVASGSTVLPLILDLEAFCTEQTTKQAANIPARLADLRWVKNKVFFASVTDQLLALYR